MHPNRYKKKQASGKALFAAVLAMTLSLPVWADMTGAGDAAMMTQLVEMVSQAKQQVAEARNMVNITKRLEEMERLKAVRDVSKEGEALSHMLRDTQTIQSNTGQWYDDPFGTRPIERDIDRLKTQLNDAHQRGSLQEAQAIAQLLADTERLRWLGKMHEESLQRVADGSNDSDHHAITASSQLIMTDILLENQQRTAAKEAQEVTALQDLLRGMRYSGMENRW